MIDMAGRSRVLRMALLGGVLGVFSASAAPAQQEQAPPPGEGWRDITFGTTLEGYYQFNFNEPADRINVLRAYDSRANSFSLQQAAIVIDAAPKVDAGRRFGVRLDFQFGQATEAVQGGVANEPRPDVYRHVWRRTDRTCFRSDAKRLDDEGLFGGLDQVLHEITLTGEYKFADGFLVRGEFRRDWSSERFFAAPTSATPRAHQNTVLVGLVWWIGNMQGAW